VACEVPAGSLAEGISQLHISSVTLLSWYVKLLRTIQV
jgi:hypothetical protein